MISLVIIHDELKTSKKKFFSESTCPKRFARMLQSFHVLESLILGIKVNTFDQRIRRIVGWLANGDLEWLDFSIDVTPL